jgi:hypothetical protein
MTNLNTENKATMEEDPDGPVSTRFQRTCRIPYGPSKVQIHQGTHICGCGFDII